MRRAVLVFVVFFMPVFCLQAGDKKETFMVPVMGQSILIFDQSAGEKRPWYINDHCVVKGPDSRYHLFGITHTKEIIPPAWSEHIFAHASSPELLQTPWQKHPLALKYDRKFGETHVWAPHVMEKDGSYYMFYAAGGGHWDSMINLAVSKDLFKWERPPVNPLFRDFYDARDPMVIKYADEYLLYYTKTFSKSDHRSTVAFRRSKDLIHWSGPEFALTLNEYPRLVNSGHTESPYVFEYGGKYYLAICSPFYHYRFTRIFISDNPYRFDEKNEITAFIAHCAEILNFDGGWQASHAGWFYEGVYLAPINWMKAAAFKPQFVVINAGEIEQYLVAKNKVKNIKPLPQEILPVNPVLEIKPGWFVRMKIPVPKEAGRIQLFICGKGSYEILINGKTASHPKDAASSEGLDLYWLEGGPGWQKGFLELTVQAGKDDPGYRFNFLRLYFL